MVANHLASAGRKSGMLMELIVTGVVGSVLDIVSGWLLVWENGYVFPGRSGLVRIRVQ